MKKLLLVGCLFAVASYLFAADDAKLRDAMKQIGPTCSGLGKKLTAKDATSAEDAKSLSKWFSSDVHKYWKSKKADDAVDFSKTASAEFKNVSKHSADGKWEEAQASFKAATATCAGCHKVHREKAADGSYSIK